jgi:predicted nucleic acid-binding protein
MPADTVVVDASALAALLFGEPEGPAVARRMEGRPLLAPTLLRYEMASVCVKKIGEEPEQAAGLQRPGSPRTMLPTSGSSGSWGRSS